MKKLFYLIIAISSFSCKKSANTTTPARKDITQAVYASGKIYPVNDYKVHSKLPGYIEKIYVNVGEIVTIGQPLLTIKSEISELNVQAAQNSLELAQKNASENSSLLMILKEEIASAKSRYELDSSNWIRFSNLFKENATSKNQYDNAKTQFDISRQNFLKASNNFINTRDRIHTELKNAKIQYEAQSSNKSDYTIISAVNGKIYDVIPKEGELVNTQTILMEVGDEEKYEVELSVDETDISLIKKDQEIVYSIDAYKDIFFKGRVIEAYPRINQSNKTSKITSSISFSRKVNVYSGMSVEANIIISEKKNALVIPREFLIDGKKVKLKSTGELVEIKKGAEDLESIEIIDGIDETTEIVKL